MSFLLNLAFFTFVMLGVATVSIPSYISGLFTSSTGTIDSNSNSNRQTGIIQSLLNIPKYGKSSLGLANVSEDGTNIGIRAKVSPFSLLCDAIELLFKGNPIYEAFIQKILEYIEKMICFDIGSPESPTSYKAVRIAYVLAKDIAFKRFTYSLF